MRERMMKKFKYNINNLDCANCAREVEESLSENEDFENVRVNFSTSKLTFESDKDFTLSELNKLVKKVEPDAYLSMINEEVKTKNNLLFLILGTIVGLFAYFVNLPSTLKYILYGISYFFLLYRTFINAIKVLVKNKSLNENALITISSIGALLLKNVLEGMMVVILYSIGKILEEKAINNSRKSIKSLLDIATPYANLVKGNGQVVIRTEEVKVGDILVVKKGEKIPVDGVLISENSVFDTSMLTGESTPLVLNRDDKVLSGFINMGDMIKIKATSLFENSTVSKILEMLEEASDKKAKTETMVNKMSKVYTPIVLILSILIIFALPLIFNISFSESIYRGLTFLVISCPCAIAISVPLSYFTAIGSLSKEGVLVKGSNYLDNLCYVKNVIFDKTGTLTNGVFSLNNIIIEDEDINDKYTEEVIMDILFKGESLSNHPIAKAIMSLCDYEVNTDDVSNFKEEVGKGISFNLNKDLVTIGKVSSEECDKNDLLHMHINKKHIASILINDDVKENAKKVISDLKDIGIKTYMFTGDKKNAALSVKNKLGVDEVKYEMLPTDKFQCYDEVQKSGTSIFVGDGINDAPTLKRADIGISMGAIGSDSAIEASDIVLMTDDISKVPYTIKKSKFTKHIITENLIFALSVKLIILVLSALGHANMWLAVFADTGVTLITILNTLRIIKK